MLHVWVSCMIWCGTIFRRCEADNSMSHPGVEGGGVGADQSNQFFLLLTFKSSQFASHAFMASRPCVYSMETLVDNSFDIQILIWNWRKEGLNSQGIHFLKFYFYTGDSGRHFSFNNGHSKGHSPVFLFQTLHSISVSFVVIYNKSSVDAFPWLCQGSHNMCYLWRSLCFGNLFFLGMFSCPPMFLWTGFSLVLRPTLAGRPHIIKKTAYWHQTKASSTKVYEQAHTNWHRIAKE